MSLTTRRIQGLGWQRDLPDGRDRIYNLEERIHVAAKLPAKIDLAANMPPIYDQGQLGSCTGNGVARCLEYEATRQGEPASTPSRLFIYYGEREIEGTIDTDSGAQVRDGIKVVAHLGAPPESEWPYDISRFAQRPPTSAYTSALAHEAIQYQRIVVGGPGAPMRTALASGLPIVFGFSVPAMFESGAWSPTLDPLPLPGPSEPIIGGHCVVVTGYDFSRERFPSPAFQCDNSWSASWGMQGRFWMDHKWFDPALQLADDLWCISRVE